MSSSKKGYLCFIILFLILGMVCHVSAQPNSYIRIDSKDKPQKYQTKILPVEKSNDQEIISEQGELKGFKRFKQGLYTHFNFLFNANTKLNEALTQSQSQFLDDYTSLLPYDNYDLKTMANHYYLDTVIEKANGSLLLHDIRNQWNDEVYLVLGKAFYYKTIWDTAAIHFQYLNYAFAPKDDGYDIPIGSNVSNKEQQLTIASPRPKSIFKHNPRRNEGLIWLARSLVMGGDITTGKGILDLIYSDTNFPKDLRSMLHDCNARAFYFSKQYDSAAYYIDESPAAAVNNLDKSRRRFLAAQLWNLSGHPKEAIKDFEYAASHSPNILMEIYAVLNLSSLDSSSNNQLDRLLKLSKKSKYKDYQDLIYYLMAEKYLGKKDSTNAVEYYTAATRSFFGNNKEWKNRSFQKLGDISENRLQFNNLVNNYDSISGSFGSKEESEILQNRKNATKDLGKSLQLIYVQDSLLHLASLPEKEQEKILKEHLRKIRKTLGLKDQYNIAISPLSNNMVATDLFSGTTNKSGQWYFNNDEVKAQGYQSFITKFGTRPNVDNWIHESAIKSAAAMNNNNPLDSNNIAKIIDSSLINMQYLKQQLLNTPEKQQKAHRNIADAYLQAGKIMEGKMYNYPAAIWFYKKAVGEDLSYNKNKEELLYRLSTSYFEYGDKKAAYTLREQLQSQFPRSHYLNATSNRNNKKDSVTSESTIAGKAYANVYNEMISGEFAKAKSDKIKADSIFGRQYWTPQLLYIESIYYVSERQDSTALFKLKTLMRMFPQSPIKPLAETMINVLSRRKEIESYLTNLKITKLEDTDEVFMRKGIDEEFAAKLSEKKPLKVKDTITSELKQNITFSLPKIPGIKVDTTSQNGIPPYIVALDSPHYVVVLLDKVAKVFATETGNAFNRFNKQFYSNQNLNLRSQVLDDRYQMKLIGPFKDAGDAFIYMDKVAPITATRILPWLTKDKYSFTIISDRNLNILLQYKTLENYKARLHETLPSKF